MIVKESLIEPLNAQIQSEFGASAQYIAIAVHFDDEGLEDLAAFFYSQSLEERDHAMRFVHFLLESGVKPTIPGLPELRNHFDSASDAVEFALQQEIKVTNQINNLVDIATRDGDHITNNFLQWFVDEQREEVDSMSTLLQVIRHAGPALLMVEDYVRRKMAAGDDGEAGGE